MVIRWVGGSCNFTEEGGGVAREEMTWSTSSFGRESNGDGAEPETDMMRGHW